MTYAISDIHGCYDKYRKMLKELNFTDRDVLYVLGDVLDRGAQPVEVLRDMSMRANVIPIMGNHEFVAHNILKNLLLNDITEENIKEFFGTEEAMMRFAQDLEAWGNDGGTTTIKGFGKLNNDERSFLIEYLEEFSLFEAVKVNGKNFLLTHAGIPEGAKLKTLRNYMAYDFLVAKTDYSKRYFDNVYLVTGHIPTFILSPKHRGKIYCNNNHIAIDTGAVFTHESGVLGCICLDTFDEFYV